MQDWGMNDLAGRLRDAGSALLGLRGALVAGEPWPLSAAYGTEPEADWGPREVLAHVNEMLGYWPRQLEAVLAGDPAVAAPFGRVAADPSRIHRIEVDRERPAGELLDGIDAGLADATAFVEALSPTDLARSATHPTRGEMSVGTAIEFFLADHLEGHVAQVREILARSAQREPGQTGTTG
ncbi:MAG TPA: DinB family protein [Candidatus Limnocylindrales bacterium]|nr:DinB family protein [Candidatus Limnocylindrales bacterium]